jgi:hypothetical protein
MVAGPDAWPYDGRPRQWPRGAGTPGAVTHDEVPLTSTTNGQRRSIPFDPEAANLMFSLVSARYERASLIVTSNKPFSAWDDIFGDEMTAVAMIDRLVHHAEILSLKGDSYRLPDNNLGARPGAQPAEIA